MDLHPGRPQDGLRREAAADSDRSPGSSGSAAVPAAGLHILLLQPGRLRGEGPRRAQVSPQVAHDTLTGEAAAEASARASPGRHYTTRSYYSAVRTAIKRANREASKAAEKDGHDPSEAPQIPHWHPNQLRHTAATEIRKVANLESVQAVLGHSHMKVSEVYAEKNLELAASIISRIG